MRKKEDKYDFRAFGLAIKEARKKQGLTREQVGVLYITDERFTTFINRFSSGNLAAFFNEAIQIFCRGSE